MPTLQALVTVSRAWLLRRRPFDVAEHAWKSALRV